jgi:uncharacterized protein (DUF433 family)
MASSSTRPLIPLGEGVYTVAEICRILQPTMTARKVHYWLDTDLLSEAVARGGPGQPTLLSFRQLLEIRTVQRLRDELNFSLPRVRDALAWILETLFATDWQDLRFARLGDELVARGDNLEPMVVPGGQTVLDLTGLNRQIQETRHAWEAKVFDIPSRHYVVSNVRILAGAPTVRGTRIDTSLLATFATDHEIDAATLKQITRLYPKVPPEAIRDALAFEGIRIAA